MSYSEKELHQALIKLSTLMATKIIGNINPIPGDSEFMVPIKKQKIAALNLVVSHMKREIDVKNSQAFQKLRDISKYSTN